MAERHGEMRRGRHSREADIWVAMIQRCTNSNCESYPNYGGRGITICDRWLGEEGLANFIADMGRKPSGCSLDRINNDGPYSPENCRWSTRQEQQRNRRVNHNVTINGETHCLTEWAEIKGISVRTLFKRIHGLGWSEERAITEPICRHRSNKIITVGEQSMSVSEWSKVTGIPESTLRSRLSCGWNAERAVSTPLSNTGPKRNAA